MTKAAALVALFLSLTLHAQTPEKAAIDQLLTQWHQAAADADFQGYFGLMAPNSVFIGTDASENWDKDAFMSFSKPYFDQGRAGSFRAVQRNIYLSESGRMAWFDELLDTWMQLCRGSGVAVKTEDGWRIAHYVLSMTMPNEEVDGAVALKREKDSLTLRALTGLQPKN